MIGHKDASSSRLYATTCRKCTVQQALGGFADRFLASVTAFGRAEMELGPQTDNSPCRPAHIAKINNFGTPDWLSTEADRVKRLLQRRRLIKPHTDAANIGGYRCSHFFHA